MHAAQTAFPPCLKKGNGKRGESQKFFERERSVERAGQDRAWVRTSYDFTIRQAIV